MKGIYSLFGATIAGFVGVVTLHSPASHSAAVSKVTSPTSNTTTSSSPQQSPPGTTTTVAVPAQNVNGSAVGQLENYSYGQLAVKVTVTNNHIVGLSIASLQTLESYSKQLEQYAVPILKSEILKAQGTKIYAVSGATYTSEAYAYSVQNALDSLHFK